MCELIKTKGDISWFNELKFGMFIHWGLYSMPARFEWVRYYEEISNEEYKKYFNYFNPEKFNPEKWAETAYNAGMRYVVFTTKHHEGFCMWDTKYTDYKITNTEYKKNLLKEFVDAFRKKGIKIGFYYSLFDWHHPDYPIDHIHPMRNMPKEEAIRENEKRDIKKYAQYMYNQVEELMTEFGEISEIWFDNSLKPDPAYPYFKGKGHKEWNSEALVKMIRKYQPKILINDRLDLENSWDIKSPEGYQPKKWVTCNGQRVNWEVCHTISGTWGYTRDIKGWKSSKQLIHILTDTVSKGGNLLLNIGPNAFGEIQEGEKERLEAIGYWMKYNSKAVYGCTEAPKEFSVDEGNLLTYNPKTNRLYLILLNYPSCSCGMIYGPKEKIEYARFLHDHSEILLNKVEFLNCNDMSFENITTLSLPIYVPYGFEIPVVEIFLK